MQIDFIKNNYLVVPNFIDKEQAFLLSEEFKEYCLLNNALGDTQVPDSRAVYNFLPFVRLLVEKVPHVNELLGEKVLPTYTYARVYKNGNDLKRHRDRPACEISFTLNLSKDNDWPIFFQRPDGSETSVELDPGDAVMYLGCQADHWRNEFEGNECTQVFMHYVRSHGSRSWAVFDKLQQQIPTNAADTIPTTII